MAKKDKGRDRGRGAGRGLFIRKSRVDLPEPKGKFRNLFAERGMIPESMKPNSDSRQKPAAPKSE